MALRSRSPRRRSNFPPSNGIKSPFNGTTHTSHNNSSYYESHAVIPCNSDTPNRVENNSNGTASPSSTAVSITPLSAFDDNSFKILRRTEITRFRVFSRVRPFIHEELERMSPDEPLKSVVEMVGTRTILLDPTNDWSPIKEFNFDASFWSIPPSQKIQPVYADTKRIDYDSQLDVYNAVAGGCVSDAFQGFNSCIMTYGQTGSGKTYTMMGNYSPHGKIMSDKEQGEEGVIPRVCSEVFSHLELLRVLEMEKTEINTRIEYRIEVTFIEIYMEKVRDLLDPSLSKVSGKQIVMRDARVRQDPEYGPFVEDVTRYKVENWRQCCTLLERGSKFRTTCATMVHNQSSRSHAIFQLTIVKQRNIPAKDKYTAPTIKMSAARINLVDLAGSERGGFQDYVKESAQINKSLLALRRVIDNLVERQNTLMQMARQDVEGEAVMDGFHLTQVPYRDSILTWVLSDSIGGNARTSMVAALSPLEKNYGDTLATLTWSSKARNLVTVVQQNDTQSSMVNKKVSMEATLLIKQQNVDSLRETLRQLSALAESLQRSSEKAGRKFEHLKVQNKDDDRNSMAFRLQRVYRRWKHKRDMEREQALIDAKKNSLEYLRGGNADQKESLHQLEQRLSEKHGRVKNLKERLAAMQKKLKKRSSGEDVLFRKDLDETRAVYDHICQEIKQDVDFYRKQQAEFEHDAERITVEIREGNERKTELQQDVAKMRKDIARFHENVDYSKESKVLDKEIQELKKLVASLTARRDQLKAKFDELRVLNDKLYNKKRTQKV